MENLQNTQKIIERRIIEKGWENCYLRLKRLLAKMYVNGGLVKQDGKVFQILAPLSKEEIAADLKTLKEDYETGLKAIQEKWIET
ncbi:MAG: hypothetical protein AAB877_01380 [Patescibacteria group bacterium]